MGDIQFDPQKASLFNLLSAELDRNNIFLLRDKIVEQKAIFDRSGIGDEESKNLSVLFDLLDDSFQSAFQELSNISDSQIDKTVEEILVTLTKSRSEEGWSFFAKKDIEIDKMIYPSLFDDPDLDSKLKDLDYYSPNAWNNAICTRALVNWVVLLKFSPSTKSDIFSSIQIGYTYLKNCVLEGTINKYPKYFIDINTTCDVAFVIKMLYRVKNFITDYFDNLIIDPKDIQNIIDPLINSQNHDGGWPFAYQNGCNLINKSDEPSTCYTLLLLTDLKKKGIFKDTKRIDIGINYLLISESRAAKQFFWCNKDGSVNFEVTCLALQILKNNNVHPEYLEGIKIYLNTLINENLICFVQDDIEKLTNVFSGNPVKLVSLILITLLKIDTPIISPMISIPFSWIIKRSKKENRTNLIYIICCISEYLSAKKNFLSK